MKKGCLFTILAVILVPILLIGGCVLVLNGSKKVDVTWTEEDFQSYLAKGGVTFSEDRASVEDLLAGSYSSIGSVAVDTHVTNAEITAIVNKAAKDSSFLKDVRIKFGDNERVEASATIGEDLSMIYSRYPEAKKYESLLNTFKGKSVYISGTLERVENQKFEAYVEKASVGMLPLPVGQTNEYLEQIGTEINSILAGMEGFSAEEFSFDSSGLHFKGQIPQEIKGLPLE